MKKFISLFLAVFCSISISCSSDDNSIKDVKTGNVKFEVLVSQNRDSKIVTKINSVSTSEINQLFPYSKSYSNVELKSGTVLEVIFVDNTSIVSGSTFSYNLELKIAIDNVYVKTETYTVTENSIQSSFSINYILPL